MDSVLDAAEYEQFTADYQRKWLELNRKEG